MNKAYENIQAKPTIEQAIAMKLPLPWKTVDSARHQVWAVRRQRPDQLTADLYYKMKDYGVKENDIREAFYVMNGSWASLKKSLGIKNPEKTMKVFGKMKTVNAETLTQTPVNERKKVDLEPIGKLPEPSELVIKITPAIEGGYVASIPALPGCITQGETLAEVAEMIEDAKNAYLEIAAEITEKPHLLTQEEREAIFAADETSGLAKDQSHYNATGEFQPIEVMQAFMTPEQFEGFLRGNVIKYSCRAGRKDDQKKEVDKVIQYATWWRQAMNGERINPREGR